MDIYDEEEMKQLQKILTDYVNEIDYWEDQRTTENDDPTDEEWERIENAQEQEEKWESRLAYFVQSYMKDGKKGFSACVETYKKWDELENANKKDRI